MSKKLKTRLLLVIVASVWGYNIYRSVQNYQTEQALEETEQSLNTSSFSPIMFNKDSFELVLPDVDPFLKKHSKWSSSNSSSFSNQSHTSTNSNKTTRKNIVKPEVKQVKPWPDIKYLGYVKNLDKSTALCLIKINGSMNKVSKGDEATGVYVSNVFRDSVHLVYAGEERTFVKG